jgi:large subunit ribosomal protein L35
MTGTGKILRTKGGKSHLRRRKSDRAKRLYDEMISTSPSDRQKLLRLLPYGLR